MLAEAGRQAQAFFLSLFATLSVNYAAAQDCEVDADCSAGYACEVYEDRICTGQVCARGEACPPPVCETIRRGYCANAPCSADADCPDPMVCHAELNEVCTDYPSKACPDDGTPCEPVPERPSDCTTELKEARCTQPYDLPCAADADCGGGFRCEEQIIRWCSGSSGRLVDGGVVTPPPEPECGEEPTGEYACRLLEQACAADSECPSGMACVDNPSRLVCRRPPPSMGVALDAGAGVAVPVTPRPVPPAILDGGVPERAPLPVDPTVICDEIPNAPAKVCFPRSWGGSRGSDDDGSSTTDPGDDESGSTDESDGTDETVAPPSEGEGGRPRRGRLLGWLRRALRDGRGCAVAQGERDESFELSWLLLAGALAVQATRRRR